MTEYGRYRVFYRIDNGRGYVYESGDFILPTIRDAASLTDAEVEIGRLVNLGTDQPCRVRINDFELLTAA